MKNIISKILETICNWLSRRWDDYNENFKKYNL